MRYPIKHSIALLIAAALAGCASGGDTRPEDPGPPPPDNGLADLVCFLSLGLNCAGSSAASRKSDATASAPASPPPGVMVSWDDGQADGGKTASTFGTLKEVDVIRGSDGAIVSEDKGYHITGINLRYDGSGTLETSSNLQPFGASSRRSTVSDNPWAEVFWSYRTTDETTRYTVVPTQGVEVIANPYALGWNYQSFGVWSSTQSGTDKIYGMTFGSATASRLDIPIVPHSGSAVFTGKLAGIYAPATGPGSIAVADLQVSVDFSARSMVLGSTGTALTRDFSTMTPAPRLDLSGTLTYAQGQGNFHGTLTSAGGALSGGTGGEFYGPAASELGGAFALKSAATSETFVGAYGAKR